MAKKLIQSAAKVILILVRQLYEALKVDSSHLFPQYSILYSSGRFNSVILLFFYCFYFIECVIRTIYFPGFVLSVTYRT